MASCPRLSIQATILRSGPEVVSVPLDFPFPTSSGVESLYEQAGMEDPVFLACCSWVRDCGLWVGVGLKKGVPDLWDVLTNNWASSAVSWKGWEMLVACPSRRHPVDLDHSMRREQGLSSSSQTLLPWMKLHQAALCDGKGGMKWVVAQLSDSHCSYWVLVDLLKEILHLSYALRAISKNLD